MSICFHVNGIILMNDKNSDFIKEFGELCLKYDDTCLFQMNDSGSLKFKLYARHYFMNDFKDLVNDKIDSINSGQIHFSCTDEDGSLNHPFPYYVYVEICEGNFFEQVIETRLPYDWGYYNEQDSFHDVIEERRAEIIEFKLKEREKKRLEHLRMQEEFNEKVKRGEIVISHDDDLPF